MRELARQETALVHVPRTIDPGSGSIRRPSPIGVSWKEPAEKKMDERHNTSKCKPKSDWSNIYLRTVDNVQVTQLLICLSAVLPDQYARAIWEFSYLPDGAGDNYTWLSWFLKHDQQLRETSPLATSLVIQYPLAMEKDRSLSHSGDQSIQKHGRYRQRDPISFCNPDDFYKNSLGEGCNDSQSGIIFLRGYRSAPWVKSIGARFTVDPEFFCRHMDFQDPDQPPKNFSMPCLPSSSSQLIELSVLTIGIDESCEILQGKTIQTAREDIEKALNKFRARVTSMQSGDMEDGESMIRDFYLFDGTHFAVEQRISICLEKSRDGKTFQCESLFYTSV